MGWWTAASGAVCSGVATAVCLVGSGEGVRMSWCSLDRVSCAIGSETMRGLARNCLGDSSSVTLISGEVCSSLRRGEEPGVCSFDDPLALELFLVTGPLSGSSSLDSLSSNSSTSEASCSSPSGAFSASDWMHACAPRVLYLSLPCGSFAIFSSVGASVDKAGFVGVSAEEDSELLSEFSESLPELSESDSEYSNLAGGRSLSGETSTLSDSSNE